MNWLITTLQAHPELAICLALFIGYWGGGKSFKGFSLGVVTCTLLAGILIGQLHITVSGPLKSLSFLFFLFAVGYGIGPQFVRGIAKDGLPQAAFAVAQSIFSLAAVYLCAKVAGYDIGSAAGLLAGSQTMSAAMGLSTDAINRLGLDPKQSEALLSAMPVAYAVTYIFGTVGAGIVLSQVLPRLMRINLKDACKDYEAKFGFVESVSAEGTAWHDYQLRAYSFADGHLADNMTVGQFEHQFPEHRVFVEGIRRAGKVLESSPKLLLLPGDILAIGGDHDAIVKYFGDAPEFQEVEDQELINQPEAGIDVYVTKKTMDGMSIAELNNLGSTHGVFLRHIKRGMTGTEIPLLPSTKLHRGDIITLHGLAKDVTRAAAEFGTVDKHTKVADVSFIGGAIFIGALIGAVVIHLGGVPITLSTAGGALIAGLIFGWLRSIHPTVGYIPEPTVWFMNSVGLNVFIAIVGLSAGPNFVSGFKALGFSLFLWGVAATTLPLLCGALFGRYIMRLHPAILFGCCAGARTTTAALAMINDQAQSNIPSLGYTVTYAVGNTFLTLWGMVIVMLMS